MGIIPIMETQMEKNMDHEMEAGILWEIYRVDAQAWALPPTQ